MNGKLFMILMLGGLYAALQILPPLLYLQIFEVMIPEHMAGQIVQTVWILTSFSVSGAGILAVMNLILFEWKREPFFRVSLMTLLLHVHIPILMSIHMGITIKMLITFFLLMLCYMFLQKKRYRILQEPLLTVFRLAAPAMIFIWIISAGDFRAGSFVAYITSYLIWQGGVMAWLREWSKYKEVKFEKNHCYDGVF